MLLLMHVFVFNVRCFFACFHLVIDFMLSSQPPFCLLSLCFGLNSPSLLISTTSQQDTGWSISLSFCSYRHLQAMKL